MKAEFSDIIRLHSVTALPGQTFLVGKDRWTVLHVTRHSSDHIALVANNAGDIAATTAGRVLGCHATLVAAETAPAMWGQLVKGPAHCLEGKTDGKYVFKCKLSSERPGEDWILLGSPPSRELQWKWWESTPWLDEDGEVRVRPSKNTGPKTIHDFEGLLPSWLTDKWKKS